MYIYIVVKETWKMPPAAQEAYDMYLTDYEILQVFSGSKLAKQYIDNKPHMKIARRKLVLKGK